MTSAGDELVDIVDADDNVIDVVTRRAMRAGRLRHRAVYIVVIDGGGGRVLVHQRSFDKDVAPGWWDIAVGGVVGSGERYDDAAAREVAEEIGIAVTFGGPAGDGAGGALPRLEPLGAARFDGDELHVLGRVYRLAHEGPFTFADGEVIDATWVTLDELDGLVDEQSFCPDSLAIVLPFLRGSRTHLS